MFQTIVKSLFGSSNDRYVKSIEKIVSQINALEPQIQALSDEDILEKGGNKSNVAARLDEQFRKCGECHRYEE